MTMHHLIFAAGEDYTGISRNLDFAPGVTMQTVRVYIQDDLGQPRLEGEETFELVLRMPMNAVLGSPERTVITINDTVSDCEYRGSSSFSLSLFMYGCICKYVSKEIDHWSCNNRLTWTSLDIEVSM